MGRVGLLEGVATPMKWGFLADAVVLLCGQGKAGEPLIHWHRRSGVDFALVATDFLELMLEGDRNRGRFDFSSGVGRVVESLELYGWAVKVFPEMSTDRLREALLGIWCICKKWQREEILEEAEANQLEEFFSGIARITLRETDQALSC